MRASHGIRIIDARPIPSATQVVISAGYVIELGQVRKSWALREKIAGEIAMEIREAERPQLASLMTALSASITAPDVTGTAVERLAKVEARMLRLERIARHYLRGL